ncbi:unnamed protein product [Camellia sinensis]
MLRIRMLDLVLKASPQDSKEPQTARILLYKLFYDQTDQGMTQSVEVKAGQPLKVNLEVGSVIHISQAALGEGKKGKGNDIVPLQVNINGKKLVLGSLSAGKFPQVSFDLVFEKEFELSHGSVYFCGYSIQ